MSEKGNEDIKNEAMSVCQRHIGANWKHSYYKPGVTGRATMKRVNTLLPKAWIDIHESIVI